MSISSNYVISSSQLLLDANFSQSVRWNERTLTDELETQSISWHNRIGYNADGNETINWSTSTLFDTSKSQSLVWKNRAGYDVNGDESFNWDSKSLLGSWSVDPGTGNFSICTYGQMISASGGGGGSVSFPLDTLNTNLPFLQAHASSQKVLVASNGALILGTDTEEQPFIQDPVTGHRLGFDDGASPYASGLTNYGVFKVVGLGDLHTEASIAFYNFNTNNSATDYWVAGVDVGNDSGNGNFNIWNGSNNVVAKIYPNGNLNTTGYIVDQATTQSIDFNNRYLSDSQGNSVVEWVGQGLGGEGGYTGGIIFQPTPGVGLCSIVNWPSVPSCSVDSNFFYLNDVGGNTTVDWNGKLLLGNWGVYGTLVDGTQATTIDTNNRTLYATDGATPLLNWSGSYVHMDKLGVSLIKGTYPEAPYDYTAFDVNNRVLHDGNNVPVINFQANSSGDTSTYLTVDSNANQVTVNSARLIVNGYIQSPTGSFDIVNATSYTGDGSQLTGITVSNSKVPINLAYNPVVVIDPSQGSYFKCILNGDVEFQTATGGIQDGQEINLMVIAAGAGSAMTLTGVQIGTDSTYTNPKTLTSFLLYIVNFKWSNDAGSWCLTSISGGFNGY